MIEKLKEEILSKGFQILNNEPTRINDTHDANPACLDLIMTNSLQKITGYQAGISAFSDHSLQTLTRSTKGIDKKQKYLRMRSFVNFNIQEFKTNILEHHLYIPSNYEPDPETIATNLQKILQDSIDPLAPIKILQVKPKNNKNLSTKAKEALADRDIAYDEYKRSKTQENLRFYRNLKNNANKIISKEKFNRKVKKFQNESESINKKWKTLKNETGKGKVTTPQILKENNNFHTKSENIANSLNRQYVRKTASLIENMEPATQDPLTKYKNSIKQPKTTFTFKKINVSDLRKTMNNMKGTGSMGYDDLSLKTIKQVQKEVEPILLHLINRCIATTTFPNTLKISKIVPIQKPKKDPTLVEGWRPVNILNSISKIIERVFLLQMSQHMEENDLIDQSHHGAVKKKSTQTLISELHDKLVEDDANGKESILLILDQSQAYDVIPHDILLRKLEAVGYQPQALKMMRSFLSDRKQLVQVEGARSELLACGPRSVIQGSTLSCILYLVYILDMPQLVPRGET